MLDVDFRALWAHERGTFGCWFVSLGVLAKYLVSRHVARLSLWSALAADATMNVASWLVVVAVPLAIVPWVVVHRLISERIPQGSVGPFGWLSVLFVSVILAVLVDAAVLRFVFRRKLTCQVVVCLFLANVLGVAIAAYQATEHAIKNPPIARLSMDDQPQIGTVIQKYSEYSE